MEIAIGLVTGVGAIALARALKWQSWYYTVALLVLPTAYAAFAVSAGDWDMAGKEMLLGAPFFIAAFAFSSKSIRNSAIVIGILWLSHGAYDLWGGQVVVNAGVPSWYRPFCAAVDLVIGVYLLLLAQKLEGFNIRNLKA
jgi:hypothetical protein